MGKLSVAAPTTGIIGISAATVYGAYALGAFGGSSLPATIEEFQQKNNQGRCFSSTTGIFDKGLPSGQIGDINSNVTNFESQMDVKWDDSSSLIPSKGCLDYAGTVGSGDKKGEESRFRLVWVVSKGNTAFSVYLTAKGKSDKSFEFDGIAYVFKREKETSGGKTERKWVINKKTLSSSEIASKFLKKGTSFQGEKHLNEYWNFLNGTGTDLSDTQSSDAKYAIFQWKEEGGVGIDSGTSNLDVWWSHFFDKFKGNMSELVTNIRGKGNIN